MATRLAPFLVLGTFTSFYTLRTTDLHDPHRFSFTHQPPHVVYTLLQQKPPKTFNRYVNFLLHALISVSSTQHHALSRHYILHDSLLTIASGTTLAKMHCPEGAQPPEGWSYLVMVPIDNNTLQQYYQTCRVGTLIECTIEGLVIYQNLRVSRKETLLPHGFVPVHIQVPSTVTVQPDDQTIISSAYLTARDWQVRYEAFGEVPQPIRLFLERLERP